MNQRKKIIATQLLSLRCFLLTWSINALTFDRKGNNKCQAFFISSQGNL